MALRSDVIHERLAKLEEVTNVLGQLQGMDGPALRADPFKLYTVERGLQVAIECILDISSHIIAASGCRKPQDYTEVIDLLVELGVIPHPFGEHIRPLAGLRNLLVHMYLKVDPNKLAQHLQRLDDFRAFARYVLGYLESRGPRERTY
ncbi:MAG: type VII toxin-antitoxin system HepT family RNase toxin [Anaerolineae bacterium]